MSHALYAPFVRKEISPPWKARPLVTKQLLGNVFRTFQNGWILVEMLSFLLVVFRFFLMEFQLVFIHENKILLINISGMSFF